jgi:hypothetical protein
MKPGPGSIPDKTIITFIYSKNGKNYAFNEDTLGVMKDLDSYTYVDRKEQLIKGNGTDAKILDFSLETLNGNDSTQAVLNQAGNYVMLFVNDFSAYEEWHNKDFDAFMAKLKTRGLPFFMVTARKADAVEKLGTNPDVHILLCDGTAVKTAARVNPTFLVMHGPVITGKYSYKNVSEIILP